MGELLFGIGQLLGLVVHLWTVGIAFNESGVLAALVTLVFPMLSEIYWVFVMWGENDPYVTCAILATLLILIGPFLSKD